MAGSCEQGKGPWSAGNLLTSRAKILTSLERRCSMELDKGRTSFKLGIGNLKPNVWCRKYEVPKENGKLGSEDRNNPQFLPDIQEK